MTKTAAAFLCLFGIYAIVLPSEAPPTGWVTEGKIVEVHDGDTVTVEVTRCFRVRLLDCWAPEVRSDNRVSPEHQAAAKKAGEASRDYLRRLVSQSSSNCILHVPIHSEDVGDAWSMGRVLGNVWLDDDKRRSISERMVEAGHATVTKQPWKPSVKKAKSP